MSLSRQPPPPYAKIALLGAPGASGDPLRVRLRCLFQALPFAICPPVERLGLNFPCFSEPPSQGSRTIRFWWRHKDLPPLAARSVLVALPWFYGSLDHQKWRSKLLGKIPLLIGNLSEEQAAAPLCGAYRGQLIRARGEDSSCGHCPPTRAHARSVNIVNYVVVLRIPKTQASQGFTLWVGSERYESGFRKVRI